MWFRFRRAGDRSPPGAGSPAIVERAPQALWRCGSPHDRTAQTSHEFYLLYFVKSTPAGAPRIVRRLLASYYVERGRTFHVSMARSEFLAGDAGFRRPAAN